MTFENWMTQRYSYEYGKGEYRDHDMQAAFTAGLQYSTPYTEGYAKGYSDGVEQQHSQLRLLAEAVLEAHLGQIFTNNEDGDNNTQRLQIRACQCEACRVAREVMDGLV